MGRVIVALALTLMGAFLPRSLEAQVAEPRTIRVSGVGEVRATPDLATIHFGVQTTGATAQEASQRNAEAMEQVIQALMRQGIRREDIMTSGFSLYPEYDVQPRPMPEPQSPPQIRGYRATNQVSVRTTDLAGIGALIDAGLAAGANQMHGIFFELRDSSVAQSAALRQAVSNARTSALAMAEALGVRLGAVLDASTGVEPVRPLFRAQAARDMAMESVMAMTPIEPGEQTVTATASLVFAIE